MTADLNKNRVFIPPRRPLTSYLTIIIWVLLITKGITGQAHLRIKQSETTEKRALPTLDTTGAGEKKRDHNTNETVLHQHSQPVNPAAFTTKPQLKNGRPIDNANYPTHTTNPPRRQAKPEHVVYFSLANNGPLAMEHQWAEKAAIKTPPCFNHAAPFRYMHKERARNKKTEKKTTATPIALEKMTRHNRKRRFFSLPNRKTIGQRSNHSHRAGNKAKNTSAMPVVPSIIARAFGIVTQAALKIVKHEHKINNRGFAGQDKQPKSALKLATKSALKHNRLRDNNVYPVAQGKTRRFYCPTENTPCYRIDENSGKRIYYTCAEGSYCRQVAIAE